MRRRSRASKKRRRSLEILVCARRGHTTPAASVARLRLQDAGLSVDLPDGRRFSRCTRCDAWVAGAPPTEPAVETLPPLPELPVPRRGDQLREALILRLISIDRAIHAVIPEGEIIPDEGVDLCEELERLAARRESRAVEIQRLRERRQAREEWADHVGGSS